MAALRAALALLAFTAFFAAPALAGGGYGSFGRPPVLTSMCPTACKVRDVVILGKGIQADAPNVDACINTCKSLGLPHYTFAPERSLCGCGTCSGGYTPMASGSGVVSGAAGSCKLFPGCSLVQSRVPACSCPSGSTCIRTDTTTKPVKYKCCCQGTNPFPIVFGGTLNSCNPTGA